MRRKGPVWGISILLMAAISAGGVTNYVSLDGGHLPPFSSWADAATNIQDAVDAVGDSVIVSNGTYYLDATLGITAGHSIESLHGAEQTVLDGRDLFRCVQMTNTTLKGFTVTHGFASRGDWNSLSGGAGIHSDGGVVSDCIVRDNYVKGSEGAGMRVSSGCVVTNCAILNNRTDSVYFTDRHGWVFTYPGTGAGVYCQDSRVVGCRISGNSGQHGGGVYAAGFSEIQKCRVEDNRAERGGGLYIESDGLVDQTYVENNTATYGGGLFINRGGTFRNGFVWGNRTAVIPTDWPIGLPIVSGPGDNHGGGAYLSGAGTIESSTLVGNGAESNGVGGIYLEANYDDPADSVVRNCIIYDNEGMNISTSMPNATIVWNCIEDGPLGDGNITNNPGLLDSNTCLFGISSPCFGSGTNVDWMAQGVDLFGNARVRSTIVDIGAYSYTPLTAEFLGTPVEGINSFSSQFRAMLSETNLDDLYFRWDFDDDGSVDVEGWGADSTSFLYSTAGTYTVALSVSNATGDVRTFIRDDYVAVQPPVEADFYTHSLTAAAPATISFHERSQHNPHVWSWDFDDDGQADSTEQYPVCTFTDVGIYSVSLTVSNDFGVGGTSTSTRTRTNYVTIIPPVVARFSATPSVVEVGQEVVFNDESENGPTSWEWHFGSEAITNVQHPVRSYDSPGWKSARLDVSSRYSSASHYVADAVKVLGPTPNHYVSSEGMHIHPFTNWITAATNIQSAIEASDEPDTVWIDSGVYTSAGGVEYGTNVFVLKKKVEIQGCGETVIDGKGLMRGANVSEGTVRHLTFRNGWAAAKLSSLAGREGSGGGVRLVSARMINCVVTGNRAELFGGGVYAYSSSIENCTIVDNSTLGSGGGLCAGASAGMGTSGDVVGGSSIQNTIIFNNEASSAPSYFNNWSASRFLYCCYAPNPGGMDIDPGGGLFEPGDGLDLANHMGSITNDPGFELDSDYRLGVDSPCINAGTNLDWMSGTVDIDNHPRILYGVADMGAHEYFEGTSITGMDISDGVISVAWTALSGAEYQLQACDDLLSADWVNVGNPAIASGTARSMSAPGLAGPPRFYRIVLTQWPTDE